MPQIPYLNFTEDKTQFSFPSDIQIHRAIMSGKLNSYVYPSKNDLMYYTLNIAEIKSIKLLLGIYKNLQRFNSSP